MSFRRGEYFIRLNMMEWMNKNLITVALFCHFVQSTRTKSTHIFNQIHYIHLFILLRNMLTFIAHCICSFSCCCCFFFYYYQFHCTLTKSWGSEDGEMRWMDACTLFVCPDVRQAKWETRNRLVIGRENKRLSKWKKCE